MTTADPSLLFGNLCDLEAMERAALPAFCNRNQGELFLEYREDESLRIEDGLALSPSFNFKRGFGLRTFRDDTSKYSYSSSLDEPAIKKAVEVVGNNSLSPAGCVSRELHRAQTKSSLYSDAYFINSINLEDKMAFLKDIDAIARSRDNVRQVTASLASSWQVVCILDDSGRKIFDIRPLVRLSVSVVMEKNGVLESGTFSGGGRHGYDSIISDSTKTLYVNEALREASVKLEAIKAPAGEMPVVLGNGWTGILLHEAIGHGLEGDSIRKKTSSFYNLLGEQIASDNVTVVDDGTLHSRRGSINIDDEGTVSGRTTLIENGKLVGFLQDRMNASLMGMNSSGNGRRESYEKMPLVRMTNTFMLNGNSCFDEMVSSLKRGIFAKSFSGGQVDVTSGKFVFSASEAYLIENGKITSPIKGAMLIGDGPSILKKISMVGNDFSMDNGVGTCGKSGQLVPVGVGEPSVLIDKITVGGASL